MAKPDMQAAADSEDQAEPQDDGDQGKGGGDVMQIVQTVIQGLSELSDIMDQAPGITPQDKQQMAQVISMFSDLVQSKLGAEPGQEPQSPDQGAVPMQAGQNGIPMGPQSGPQKQ